MSDGDFVHDYHYTGRSERRLAPVFDLEFIFTPVAKNQLAQQI